MTLPPRPRWSLFGFALPFLAPALSSPAVAQGAATAERPAALGQANDESRSLVARLDALAELSLDDDVPGLIEAVVQELRTAIARGPIDAAEAAPGDQEQGGDLVDLVQRNDRVDRDAEPRVLHEDHGLLAAHGRAAGHAERGVFARGGQVGHVGLLVEVGEQALDQRAGHAGEEVVASLAQRGEELRRSEGRHG